MNNNRMTLEEFKSKAIDKFQNRKLVADIEVEGFGPLPFNRPSDNDMLEYLNGAARGAKVVNGEVKETDLLPVAEASKILVYKCCAFLHDSELQESVEVIDPYDTPSKVFGLTETINIAEKITDVFNSSEVKEEIKN